LRSIISEATKRYKWYHVSQTDLGDEFTFTPRQPRFPMRGMGGSVIEDDFTPRVSWAPCISDAINALGGSIKKSSIFYVYATNRLPGEVDVEENFLDAPSSPDNEYGPAFSVGEFIDYAEDEGWSEAMLRSPPESKHSVIRALKGQVPDAPETHEYWATKPVTAKKIASGSLAKILLL